MSFLYLFNTIETNTFSSIGGMGKNDGQKILPHSLSDSVTMDKLPNLSMPLFSHL